MNPRITLWFAVAFASSVSLSSSLGSESCNAFVDDVLNQLKENEEFFQEPYEIPEEDRSFGLYEVESGHVYGLTTLHRVDDVVPMKKSLPYLKVYLGAGELSIKCKVKKKYLSLGKSANVDSNVPFVSIELDIVPKADGSNPEIKAFKVDEVKGLSVQVSGKGLIRDFFLNAFAQVFGRFFKNTVKSGIEGRLKKFLKSKVHEFTIPAECLNQALY